MRTYVKIVIASLLLCQVAFAQNKSKVTINVSESNPEQGEEFYIDYVLTAKVKGSSMSSLKRNVKVTRPDFGKLTLVREGSTNTFSFNSFYSSGSGSTQSFTYTYRYILKGSQVGLHNIGPASFKAGGKTIKSAGTKVRVIKKRKDPELTKSVSWILSSTRRSMYIGEKAQLTIRYYSAYNTNGGAIDGSPKIEGFSIKPVEFKSYQKVKTIKGRQYVTDVVEKYSLTPIKTGKIKIGPIKGIMQLRNGYYGTQSHKVESNSLYINVKPLPEQGKPEGFTGLLGNFKLSQSIDKKELNVNDALTLKYTLAGSGNLKAFEAPTLNLTGDLETIEPTEKVNYNQSGTYGTKTFEFVVIPRKGGKYTIPPISIPFFDTDLGKYVELKSDSIEIKVNSTGQTLGGKGKKEVDVSKRELRYIEPSFSTNKNKPSDFGGSTIHYSILGIGGAGYIVLLILFRKRKGNEKAELAAFRKRAAKRAFKGLKAKGSKDEYEWVDVVLSDYFKERFGIDNQGFSTSTLFNTLKENNIPENYCKEAIDILNKCKMGRYSHLAAQTKDLSNDAHELINNIEKNINA